MRRSAISSSPGWWRTVTIIWDMATEMDLWANDEWEQIEIMQALYESFPPEKKPEWLTPDDILGYGERMLTPLGEI